MYDPLLSSFLSPDNYMQDPTSQQGFNRYAYCMYNPLKYVDPSGYRYYGYDESYMYRVIDEITQQVLHEWYSVYDMAVASVQLTINMACGLYSHGLDTHTNGSGNHGSAMGGCNDPHIDVWDNGDGTYTVVGGELNSDHSIVVINGDNAGSVIGTYLTNNSYVNEDNEIVTGALIDLNDNLGQDFWDFFTSYIPGIDTYIASMAIGSLEGIIYGFNTSPLNFKAMGFKNGEIKTYSYRGMPINFGDGITYITTARDIGNAYAGFLFGYYGWSYESTRNRFDWFNGGPEPPVSKCAQDYGYYLGQHYYLINH